jgi:AraC-like DNA-binding protein
MPEFKFNAHKRFHIVRSNTHAWEPSQELTQHNRFLFILSGEGILNLDGQRYAYLPQGVILLKPDQRPVLQENTLTELFVIAFDTFLAEDFQQKKSLYPDFADIYKQAEHICEEAVLEQGKQIPVQKDVAAIDNLISLMSEELMQRRDHHYKIVRNCIEMVVNILMRNNIRCHKHGQSDKEDELCNQLIQYITSEILNNRTVKISDLQIHFNVSEDVINICLLNRTGMSFKKFIRKYQLDLFKSKMLKTDLSFLAPYLQPQNI